MYKKTCKSNSLLLIVIAFTICVSVNLVFFIIDHLKLNNYSTFKWPNFREAYILILSTNNKIIYENFYQLFCSNSFPVFPSYKERK